MGEEWGGGRDSTREGLEHSALRKWALRLSRVGTCPASPNAWGGDSCSEALEVAGCCDAQCGAGIGSSILDQGSHRAWWGDLGDMRVLRAHPSHAIPSATLQYPSLSTHSPLPHQPCKCLLLPTWSPLPQPSLIKAEG